MKQATRTPPKREPQRLWLRSIGLVALPIFGILLAFAIGEAFLRVTPQKKEPRHRIVYDKHRDLPKLKISVPVLATRNIEGRLRNGAYFRNNSIGIRGPDIPRTAPPGTFRVAIIGDSVTMGAGVSNDETYSVELARLLNQGEWAQRFEVLNLGLAGLNTKQIRKRATRLLPLCNPDLIIYGWTSNDIEGPSYEKRISNDFLQQQAERYRSQARSRSIILRRYWPRMLTLWDTLRPPTGTYLEEVRFNYEQNPKAWSDFESALEGIKNLGRRHNAPVVVFLHTSLTFLNVFHPYHSIYNKVEEAAVRLGLPTIQSFDAHLGRTDRSLWVSIADSHPNPEGHRILAAALYQGLKDLPPGYLPSR